MKFKFYEFADAICAAEKIRDMIMTNGSVSFKGALEACYLAHKIEPIGYTVEEMATLGWTKTKGMYGTFDNEGLGGTLVLPEPTTLDAPSDMSVSERSLIKGLERRIANLESYVFTTRTKKQPQQRILPIM